MEPFNLEVTFFFERCALIYFYAFIRHLGEYDGPLRFGCRWFRMSRCIFDIWQQGDDVFFSVRNSEILRWSLTHVMYLEYGAGSRLEQKFLAPVQGAYAFAQRFHPLDRWRVWIEFLSPRTTVLSFGSASVLMPANFRPGFAKEFEAFYGLLYRNISTKRCLTRWATGWTLDIRAVLSQNRGWHRWLVPSVR